MKYTSIIVIMLIMATVSGSFALAQGQTEKSSTEHQRDSRSGEGEEKGIEYSIDQSCEVIQNGCYLYLSFDKDKNEFIGYAKNLSDRTLTGVRLEIHLDNGIELGPTRRVTLAPEAVVNLSLKGSSRKFSKWTAHLEVGSSEGSENSIEDGSEH